MSPDRSAVVDGKTVKEYYWAGEKVVYIGNRLSGMTFDMACEHLRQIAEQRGQVSA